MDLDPSSERQPEQRAEPPAEGESPSEDSGVLPWVALLVLLACWLAEARL